MKLYFGMIGGAMALISAVNIALGVAEWYVVILAVVGCTVLQFALDGALAFLTHVMPDSWFGVDNPLYRISEWEKRLYKRLRVRRWKDKVWELGGLGGFSKKTLLEPGSASYIEKFIVECNKGVLTHRLSYPLGFLSMLTLTGVCPLTIALPVGAVNLFLNILPTLVLRYNTPKLQVILKRLRRKQAAREEQKV
jgi:glycosyl-4,4'-diaponeurosporenoate acyltransferase